MDWSSAKKILIVVFILINIFLGYTLRDFYFNEGISQNVIDNANKIFSLNNVEFECTIPKTAGKYKILTSILQEQNKEVLVKKLLTENFNRIEELNSSDVILWESKKIEFLKNGGFWYTDSNPEGFIDLSDQRSIEQAVIMFLEKTELEIDSFIIDKVVKKSEKLIEVTFVDKLEDEYVFDNKIIVEVSNSGVKSLIYKYTKPQETSLRNTNIVNAYEVLLHNYISKKAIIITSIEKGFLSLVLENSSKKLYPILVWRIRIKDGSERFFDAYDGTEVSVE